MDLASVIGLIVGLAVVIISIMTSGDIFLFINIPSILIVVGGTACSTLLHYPLSEVLGVFKVVKKAFLHKEEVS